MCMHTQRPTFPLRPQLKDDPTIWQVDDALWAPLASLLVIDKPRKKPGRPRSDDRRILNGLIWLAGTPDASAPNSAGKGEHLCLDRCYDYQECHATAADGYICHIPPKASEVLPLPPPEHAFPPPALALGGRGRSCLIQPLSALAHSLGEAGQQLLGFYPIGSLSDHLPQTSPCPLTFWIGSKPPSGACLPVHSLFSGEMRNYETNARQHHSFHTYNN